MGRGGSFGGWLFAIARNQCLNAIRDRHEHTSIDDLSRSLVAPAQELYDEKSDLLRNAIESLPDDYREALVLRVYSGFSYQEIAEITGCNLGTVKSRLNRARNSFAAIIEPGLE